MADLKGKIADRIANEGPIPFSTFMEMALYDPDSGYYRGDPFGARGDFFTASQLQPVFGAYVSALASATVPGFDLLVDIGAGRAELAQAFPNGRYASVERGGKLDKTKCGILFSNELIDAMPVDLIDDGTLLRVKLGGDHFAWDPHPPRPGMIEIRHEVVPHLHAAYESIEQGSYILIDYGYRGQDRRRFPSGSLMSYRRHTAIEDVLKDPGSRDITAHVDWDHLISAALDTGWKLRSFDTLRASMLSLGPEVMQGIASLDEMQFRSLFMGMGESFDVLILDKK